MRKFLALLVVMMMAVVPVTTSVASAASKDSKFVKNVMASRIGMPKQLRNLYQKASPKISKNKLTLEVGETKQLKVLPKSVKKSHIWELKRVTVSDKSCLTASPNKGSLTVKVKGKQETSKVVVKIYLKMKKEPWKKYKKCRYFKSRQKVLKCTVKIISNKPDDDIHQ